jgi:hypothetical protein
VIAKTKLQIISFGNDVPKLSGKTFIHSKFTNAVNLLTEDGKFTSLVTKKVGAGPNNILLDIPDLSLISNVFWTDTKININDISIPITDVELYNPELNFNNISKTEFLSGLNFFERILIKDAPILSSSFLLDSRRKNFFITPFEKNLRDKLQRNVDEFMEGDFSAIDHLKGTGFGLTPQGDDLIDGFVTALVVYELFTGNNTFRLREEILERASTQNIISNTFLLYASKGQFYERIKNIVEAIAHNDKEKISIYTKALLDIGETSGADIGTGFILMSRKLFEGGIKWS